MAFCALVLLFRSQLYATVIPDRCGPAQYTNLCVGHRTDNSGQAMVECLERVRIPTENFMKVIYAVLVSTFVFGGAVAQSTDQSASPRASAGTSSSAMANADAKRDAAVEKHIKELHATLKITSTEESAWNEVAATMRENAKELDRAIDKRVANSAGATAIDDLNSYAEIAQAHAKGVKKLASAFSGLYSVMSDDQKKVADEVFSHRNHEGKKVANR
jgi:protein CpxP